MLGHTLPHGLELGPLEEALPRAGLAQYRDPGPPRQAVGGDCEAIGALQGGELTVDTRVRRTGALPGRHVREDLRRGHRQPPAPIEHRRRCPRPISRRSSERRPFAFYSVVSALRSSFTVMRSARTITGARVAAAPSFPFRMRLASF